MHEADVVVVVVAPNSAINNMINSSSKAMVRAKPSADRAFTEVAAVVVDRVVAVTKTKPTLRRLRAPLPTVGT